MPDGRLECDPAAEGVAHDVRWSDPEVLHEGCDVVGHQLDAEGSMDVGGPAVTLQIDGDDLPTFGERREIGAKHLDRSQTAVQQNEGAARAANLVVKLDPVHLGVAAARWPASAPHGLTCACAWAAAKMVQGTAAPRRRSRNEICCAWNAL
jgi:hypothetical protein